jgi:hypothetical protein
VTLKSKSYPPGCFTDKASFGPLAGQPLEETLRCGFASQRAREVGRHRDLARRRVELDIDIQVVVGCDARGLADFCADRVHEPIDATVLR